ncbi:MAG: glycoside hydrolase family 3 protein [Deltaproteobacteria bacterium]|nr:glycoside hydrolase family 3 protein [Deltaproteobacteria bacterium]
MKLSSQVPLLIGFDGTDLNKKLQQHLVKINPVGIVLFKRNIVSLDQTRELIRQIRDLLGQILVAIDHEGGLVNRFPGNCPAPPSPMALNRSGDEQLLVEACRMQAEILAYLGINLNFAPVLDLAAGLINPAIGTRAFSDNPLDVVRFGKICVDVHREFSIGTCAKHFPGHGKSQTDSHYATGEVLVDEPILWAEDLLPFKELIADGVPAVMLAHLIYSSLDPGTPAIFSRKIATELLREKLGFQGLVISDCVEMSAVGESNKPSRIIHQGVAAGVDLFISSFSLKKSHDFQLDLKKALQDVEPDQQRNSHQTGSTMQRLQHFLEHCPGKPAEEGVLEVMAEKTVAMHRQTIDMQRKMPLPKGYRNFFLLELSNIENKGINADEQRGLVADQLLKFLKPIRQHRILFDCDSPAVEKIIQTANQNNLTLILLTANGFRRIGYTPFLHRLREADAAIHISLMDDRDLTGNLGNEWTTWGFNSWTAAALTRELLII